MVERTRVLVFDVNETLLDLTPLQPHFAELFGSAEPMGEWFARLLHGSLVANHTNRYRPFGQIGAEALIALAKKRGIALSPERAGTILATLRRLPPYPEVTEALERLLQSGFRLVTLTNGSSETVTEQLEHSGLGRYFERSLSVEAIGRFKPAADVYLYALAELDVKADQALMVAAHDWDIIGARSVGMPGAFIERPGVVWGLPDPPPEIVVSHLGKLADLLVATM